MYILSGEATLKIDQETFFYQLTMPGIQQELLFRGILLYFLNSVFLAPRFKVLQVEFGHATIMTSILFGLSHGIELNQDFNISLDYFSFFRTILDGFIFALLTEKTKSLIPAISYHNLINLIGLH